MLCRLLAQSDLAHCARVNSKWHEIVTPYLWRDITQIGTNEQMEAFRRVVLADYNQEQRHQQLQEDMPSVTQDIRARSKTFLPPLVKFLQPPRGAPPEVLAEPNTFDLLRHFFERCTAPYLEVSGEDIESDDLFKIAVDFVTPHVSRLLAKRIPGTEYISWRGQGVDMGCLLRSYRLKHLLTRCSSKLEELSLKVHALNTAREDCWDTENESEEPREGAQPTHLVLQDCSVPMYSKFWLWLWTRCGRLEILDVGLIDEILQSLVDGIPENMPNLTKIRVGRQRPQLYGKRLKDYMIAKLLSAQLKGWRSVELRYDVEFGDLAMVALSRHFPALEELALGVNCSCTAKDLVHVLSSSPSLRTLATINNQERDYSIRASFIEFKADAFIDMDPDMGLLREWACESTLKVLKVKITGIHRQGAGSGGNGKHPVQPQHLVYERLARCVNLETLWLGHSYKEEQQRPQFDCLDMSLESGLYKLEGLKSLRELNVSNMECDIQVKDVKWMTEHWPSLRAIYGLDACRRDTEVVRWLKEHFPGIALKEDNGD